MICVYSHSVNLSRKSLSNVIKRIFKNEEKPKKLKGLAQNKFDFLTIHSKKDIVSSKKKNLKKKSKKQKKNRNENKSFHDYSDIDLEEPEVSEKRILDVELPSVELNEEDYNYVKFN